MTNKLIGIFSLFSLLLSGFTPIVSSVSAQSRQEVVCGKVEIGSRDGDHIVSGTTTNVLSSQNLALVATILNDDGNHSSITWSTTGGKVHNTSWDLTEWRAPIPPGTYTVSLSIYGTPQPNCTSTFVVLPNTSYVTCDKLETNYRYSGNVISGATTSVPAGQRMQLIASILNDDANHGSISWTTTGGVLSNYSWDLIQWTAPPVEGTYTVNMSVYGVQQPKCSATFLVTSAKPTGIDGWHPAPTSTPSASSATYPFENRFPVFIIQNVSYPISTSHQVGLKWGPIDGADYYNLHLFDSGHIEKTIPSVLHQTSFSLGLDAYSDYYIRVNACKNNGNCVTSNELFIHKLFSGNPPYGSPQVTIYPSVAPGVITITGNPVSNQNIEELNQKIGNLQNQLEQTNKRQQTLTDTLNGFISWAKTHLPFFK